MCVDDDRCLKIILKILLKYAFYIKQKTTTSTSKRASVREEGLFVFGGPTAFFEDLNHLLSALYFKFTTDTDFPI